MSNELSHYDDSELLVLYGDLMRELIRRGVVRSQNNPVGDIGERLVADAMNLILTGRSCKGFDAIAPDGTRYQIKARSRGARGWRNLMGFRDLDERLFDRVAVAILDPVTYEVELLFHFPYEAAVHYAKETTRGFKRIRLNAEFVTDPRIVWVKGQPSMVVRLPVTRERVVDSTELGSVT